jgi:hypothetical protein
MISVNTSSKKTLWIGRVLTALCVLFLLFDGITKVLKVTPVMEACERLGYAANLVPGIGLLLLTCTLLYVIPRTSILGAILLTGYLGGGTTTLVRVGEPFYFPVLMGVLIWVGLYLRDERLRSLWSRDGG